uniref:Autism susceptibility gene 2 protein-like n=1 Tax=Saccoglossus kowalevskii TaxID=10224 RepID=A0ABM0LVA8_SACKO|nr:PREDICTED: autism susceptibility gene 2 protein-like [Saccoglossus kowalevskii]
MENDAKQRSQRHKRRERAAEMKQQQQHNHNNDIGSGDDDERPPSLRDRERSRPRHKRRRSSSSHEEDIIDGFAISSFASLGHLEDGMVKAVNRSRDKYTPRSLENGTETILHKPRPGRKKVRSPHSNKCISDENTRPEETNGLPRFRSKDRLSDGSSHSSSGKGYICDSESEGDRVSDGGSDLFTASPTVPRRELGFHKPPLQTNDINTQDDHPTLPACLPPTTTTRINISNTVTVPSIDKERFPSVALSKPPTWSSGTTTTSIITSKSIISSTCSSSNHSISVVPTTSTSNSAGYSTPSRIPSNPFPLSSPRPPGPPQPPHSHPSNFPHSPVIQQHPPPLPQQHPPPPPPPPQHHPPPQANPHSMFTSTLPPPPPLTSTALPIPPAANHNFPGENNLSFVAQQDILRQELNTRFLASQDRSANIPPPPYMRSELHTHQHMHQHQHQHTHSFNLPPASLVPTPAPHMLGLPYAGISPMTGPVSSGPPSGTPVSQAGPFSSNSYGAFQPKLALTDTLLRRRASDQSNQSSRAKPGRWCAAHVNVAWHIYHQQQKEKAADVHKDALAKTDLFARSSNHMMASIHRPHELVCPTSLLHGPGKRAHDQLVLNSPVTGAAGPPNPFGNGGGGGHHFLGGSTGPLIMPPFPRALGYGSIGSGFSLAGLAGNGLLTHRDMNSLHALGSPHDAWNRLHRTPPSFPTAPPPWPGLKTETDREREALNASVNEADRERRIHELERMENRAMSNDKDAGIIRLRENDHHSERSSVHSEQGSEKSADKEKKREMNNSQDKICELESNSIIDMKIRRDISESPSRNSKDMENKLLQQNCKSESAFDNVKSKHEVKVDEKEEDSDVVIVTPERPRTDVNSVSAMMERSRVVLPHPPFGIPSHHTERLLNSAHHPHSPLAPFIEQDRYREREPHDFTRDNPLGMDTRRSDLDHLPHLAEEQVRLREDTMAAERNRILHGGDHLGLGVSRHSMYIPGGLSFAASASAKSSMSSSGLSGIPPPLVPTVSLNSNAIKPIHTQASASVSNIGQDKDELKDKSNKPDKDTR